MWKVNVRDNHGSIVVGSRDVPTAGARQRGIDVTRAIADDGVGSDGTVISADLKIRAAGGNLALGVEEVLDDAAGAGVCEDNGWWCQLVSWSVGHHVCLFGQVPSLPCTIWNSYA